MRDNREAVWAGEKAVLGVALRHLFTAPQTSVANLMIKRGIGKLCTILNIVEIENVVNENRNQSSSGNLLVGFNLAAADQENNQGEKGA